LKIGYKKKRLFLTQLAHDHGKTSKTAAKAGYITCIANKKSILVIVVI